MKLDRIVIEQRLTRTRHLWWRYTIVDNTICIYPLKKKFIDMDSLFLTLTRDIEFVKNFMSARFIITDVGEGAVIIKGDEKEYALTYGFGPEYLFTEKDGEFVSRPIEIKISQLLHIFYLLYPKYMSKHDVVDNRGLDSYHYMLNLAGEERKNWYRKSFNELFRKFKELNFDLSDKEFIISKHFAGFTKKKREIKLYHYGLCATWYIKDEHGLNMYDELVRKFSKNFRKFYIIFYKNDTIKDNETIKRLVNKRTIEAIENQPEEKESN